MISSAARSFALRSARVIFLQNSCASVNENISAELRAPFHLLGFSPITASYRFCGTSYLAIEKRYCNVTLCAGCSVAGPFSLPLTNDPGESPQPGVLAAHASVGAQ